jgi:hypothetical protein
VTSGKTRKVDWFDVGWTACKDNACDPEFLPPLNDIEAQRAWLGGFGAAWAEALEDRESVDEALAQALEGREELLRQLRSHASGRSSRTVH